MKKLTILAFVFLIITLSVISCTKPKDEKPSTELKWQDLQPQTVDNEGKVEDVPFN